MRIRFLGATSAPQLEGTKYGKGPLQRFVHWPPDDLKELIGNRATLCLGARKGCIFHQEPLKWNTNKSNYINVVVYEGVNKAGTQYKERKIIMFDCKSTLGDHIKAQCLSLQINPEERDWVLMRSGSGKNDTSYTATMMPSCIDGETIDLTEFPDQDLCADDEITAVIDPDKYNADSPMTPEAQTAWYEQLVSDQEELNNWGDDATAKPKAGTTQRKPPTAPAGAPTAAAGKPATANGQQITLPGAKRGPGRPPGSGVKAAPPAAPKAAGKAAPPPAPKPAGPSPYDLACKVLDPWGKPMKSSEGLEWLASLEPDFLESAENAEYAVTQEQIDAAKLVLAGPKKAGPPAAPKAAAQTEPEEATEGGDDDLPGLQARLLQLTKSVPTLANFKTMRTFLKELGDGATAVSKITDTARLQALIALCEEGDESVAAALEDAAGWLESLG